MRVTIEHREESAGMTGATKHHFVDCTVEFSEEENAIIKARDLYNQNFRIGPASPMASSFSYVGNGVVNSIGRLMVMGGIALMFISPFIGEMPFGPLGFFGAIAGGGVWAWAAWQSRQFGKSIAEPDQTIRLRDLINKGRFTVYAASPPRAHEIEQEIRGYLISAKKLITDSAEIKAKQTFEL